MSKKGKMDVQSVQNYLLCKFVGFLLPSSSWLLKLPIVASLNGLYKDNRCCVSGSVKRDNLRANKLIRVKLLPQNYKDQKKLRHISRVITSSFAQMKAFRRRPSLSVFLTRRVSQVSDRGEGTLPDAY